MNEHSKRKSCAVEITEQDDTRKRAESTEPQARIENCPPGISFLSAMNKRRRYFLPSVKNYFGGLQIHKLLCDSGCSSSLLPVDSVDTLREIFSWADTKYRISGGNSPGGTTISLIVMKNTPYNKFTLKLCTDILDSPALAIDHLRFSLSTEDINWILRDERAADRFSQSEIAKLRAEPKFHGRRSHGLIGQQILDQFASIKYMGCEIYVDTSKYTLPANFLELGHQLIDLVTQTKDGLPASFEDWEDDDFAFEDDDYIVDFCEEN